MSQASDLIDRVALGESATEVVRDINESDKAQLSKGFDAGNHDNAYVSDDYEKASEKRGSKMNNAAYAAGYMLGFFSSYEVNEVPMDMRDEYKGVLKGKYGKMAKQAGYID